MRYSLGVLLMVAACGDDGVNHLADAPPVQDDAAPNIDAPNPTTVRLTITDNGLPVADIKVYFQNADSSLVSATQTDASGVASAMMEPGGFVTAVDPYVLDGGHDLRTYAGVKPGDDLKLTRIRSTRGEVTVNAIVPPAPDNATFYTLYSSCAAFDGQTYDAGGGGGGSGSGGGPGGAISITACDAADLLLEARDANFNPIYTKSKTDVALTEGATVDFTAGDYIATVPRTYELINMPVQASFANITARTATARGPVFHRQFFTEVMGGAGMATMPIPASDPAQLGITETHFGSFSLGAQTVVDWGPSATTKYTLDGATLFLPTYDSPPTYDIATRTFSWSSAGGTQVPDVSLVYANFSREDQNGFLGWNWTIAAPYGTPAVVLPALPTGAMQFNPMDGDGFLIEDVWTAKVPGGYDAVRAHIQNLDRDPRQFVIGATGRVIYERVQQTEVFGKRGTGRYSKHAIPAPAARPGRRVR